VECGEDVAFVFGWKLLAGVETKTECRRVRLHEDVGHNGFARKIYVFPFVVRIDMIADIKPRPTVKPVRFHAADVIGGKSYPSSSRSFVLIQSSFVPGRKAMPTALRIPHA
jgi:hypothetical protein